MTARDAADKFASTAFDEPRKVGTWRAIPGALRHHHHADFQLENGLRWYEVWMRHDYSGWTIELKENQQ
jgi:hypothetical protein